MLMLDPVIQMDNFNYPFLKHFSDLRIAVMRSIYGVFIGLIICFLYSDKILKWFMSSLTKMADGKIKLIALTPYEYFFSEIRAAFICGILMAAPWMFYQIWFFISPGLYRNEKKFIFCFVFSSFVFFMCGVFFSQYFVLPLVFNFFIKNMPSYVEGQYSIGMLFSFSTNLILLFGVIFEIPLLIFLLTLFNFVTIEALKSIRRYVIVLAFILAAILTPTPDPFTQTAMAIPIILLYEFGIFIAQLFVLQSNE